MEILNDKESDIFFQNKSSDSAQQYNIKKRHFKLKTQRRIHLRFVRTSSY